MKELSIEEKAKRYDNVLKEVKDFFEGRQKMYSDVTQNLEYLFPELAESEDDRIRKELINYLDNFTNSEDRELVDKFIVWLEKQSNEPKWCHHKVDLSNCSEEYRKAYYDGWNNCNMQHSQCKSESNDVVKCLINGMKFYYEDNEEATWGTEKFSMKVKDILSWLEKQGTPYTKRDIDDAYLKGVTNTKNEIEKQYEANYQIRKDIATFIFNYRGDIKDRAKWMDYLGIKVSLVEKQGEQKPADKVEPKFKVGDWVVQGLNILKIRCVGNEYYCFETVGGYVGDMLVSEIDSSYHLWTIQDAKDGDVLYMNNGAADSVFINKSIDNGIIYKYASYNKFGFEGEHYLVLNDGYVIPATKEQRETLMKAMADAGYTFDFERKELKKIEQKPWSEEDEQHIRELESLVKRVWAIAERENDKDTIHKMSDLSFFLKTLKPQLKQEWSEDDEKLINSVIELIDNGALDRDEKDYFIEKLKSFKNGVLPQQKREWSEEDEKKRNLLISILNVNHPNGYFKANSANTLMHVEELIDWLKSLRPQNRWKPSDKQMDALEYYATSLSTYSDRQDDLFSLLKTLKKLKEE